jgi:hypothetical protein
MVTFDLTTAAEWEVWNDAHSLSWTWTFAANPTRVEMRLFPKYRYFNLQRFSIYIIFGIRR